MSTHATFFKQSLFVLSKNPILFLLPFAGSALSIIVEVIFTGELYYSNGNKVFFPNVILFGIFFARIHDYLFSIQIYQGNPSA